MKPSTASYSIRPFYLDGVAGRLFAISYEPEGERLGQLLFCPPFAEEMNKSRRMMTLTAQRLAAAGYAVVIVDLYGTGDSAGNFEDARWEIWVSDLENVVRWLATNSGLKISLCGIRLGANMVIAVCDNLPDLVNKVLLWQPLISGKTHMTQFLRLKLAAQLTASGPKTSTAELRALSEKGEMIEVAGYSLHPQLLAAIDAQELRCITPPTGMKVGWFEVVANDGRGVGVASRKLGANWSGSGVNLLQSAVKGEYFWTSQEITLAPELIEQTVIVLEETP
jgi:exosortase A-associated hydrolase 2